MKPQIKVLITFIVLLGLIGLFYFASQTITKVTGKSIYGWIVKDIPQDNLDSFAQCLSVSGVKMYGAYWCGHCQNNKKIFGSSVQYISYIECDPNGQNSEAGLCAEKGIDGYPTWEINGKFYPGEQSLSKLAQLSGCSLNSS